MHFRGPFRSRTALAPPGLTRRSVYVRAHLRPQHRAWWPCRSGIRPHSGRRSMWPARGATRVSKDRATGCSWRHRTGSTRFSWTSSPWSRPGPGRSPAVSTGHFAPAGTRDLRPASPGHASGRLRDGFRYVAVRSPACRNSATSGVAAAPYATVRRSRRRRRAVVPDT